MHKKIILKRIAKHGHPNAIKPSEYWKNTIKPKIVAKIKECAIVSKGR
jgi:hypothetical protein